MKALTVTLALLLGFVAIGGSQAPQRDAQVDGRPSCANCRIELTLIATLGHESDPVDIDGAVAARDSKGNIYTTVSRSRQVGVYDSTGRFVGVVGRAGQGPGEFTDIRRISIGPGDTLFVQGSVRKVAVFSPQRTFVREFLLPSGFGLGAVLRDGRLLFRHAPNPTGAVMPLALMSSQGVLLNSFGSVDSVRADSECSSCTRLVFGEGREPRTVWTSTTNKYELTEWTTDGVLRSRLVVERSAWFQAWYLPSPNPLSEPPRSTIRQVRQDRAGLIWVSGSGASGSWKPYTGPLSGRIRSSGEGLSYPLSNINAAELEYLRSDVRTRATTIDVIDPISRRVLASTRIENDAVEWELEWLSDNIVLRRDIDRDGFVRPKAFRICLRAPQQASC